MYRFRRGKWEMQLKVQLRNWAIMTWSLSNTPSAEQVGCTTHVLLLLLPAKRTQCTTFNIFVSTGGVLRTPSTSSWKIKSWENGYALNDHLWKIINFGTADIYLFFKPPLGENITESTNVPDLSIFRLADVFTSVSERWNTSCIYHKQSVNCHCRICYGHRLPWCTVDCARRPNWWY